MEMDKFNENIMLTSGKFKEEKDYWLGKLSGDIAISSFPADRKKADLSQDKKSLVKLKLPIKICKQLNKISNNSDTGLYMILLSGIKYLLNRYTNNNDLLVGMPTFSQDCKDIPEVNLVLALRTKCDGDWSYKDFLMDIKETVTDARKYINISFEMMAEMLGLQSDDGNIPRIKTLILLKNIHNYPTKALAEAEIVFSFLKVNDLIELEIEYDKELFLQSTVKKIANHLKNFYKIITENTNMKLSEVDVFTDAEKHQVLYDFNNTAVDFQKDKTIQELFEEQVNRTPDKVALVIKNTKYTYKELNEKSNQIARLLRKKGLKPDGIVGVLVERSFDMIAGLLGILKAGGAYLPIDSEYPGERIKYMLTDSGAELLLTKNKFIHYVNFDKESIYIDDEELGAYDVSNPEVINTAQNLAYVIYTSGSTGEPKGAAIEHKSVINFINGIINRIEFKSDNAILALTTICFDIFVLETLLPLTQGLKVVIADEAEQKDPRLINTLIINEKIDMLQVTPSRMQLILSYGDKLTCLAGIKVIMVGGEIFPQTLLGAIRKLSQAKIYNMYGPVETTIWSTIKEVEQDNELNIGKPIANTRVYIMGNNNNLQIAGIPGELCIAGEGLARGYINKEELTVSRFINKTFTNRSDDSIITERIYCTGDLAKWLPDGDIEFIGRLDYQVKIRGFRIELGEIEALFLKYEGINDVAVIDKTDLEGNKYLCAYVVVEAGVNFMEIKEYLSKNLPYYMLPTHYRKLDAMPLNQNGKIDRKALRKLDDLTLKTVYVEPGNDLERKLVEIWQEVLRVEKVGIDDDIEELGGNSFLAMKLELTMEMNDLEITNVEIFQNRTIRKLAEHIENKQKETDIYEANEEAEVQIHNKEEEYQED